MMKKLIFMAMVIFATIACNDENKEHLLPDVVITAPDESEIYPKKTYFFTATLSVPALEELIIQVNNDNTAVLAVDATEIKIEKGEVSGQVAFTTKTNGIAKITFNSLNANVKTSELTINVPIVDPPSYGELPEFENGTFSAVSKIVIGGKTIESSAANSPDGANKRLAGNDDFSIGAVSDDLRSTVVPLTEGVAFTIYYDNFTADDEAEMAVALYIDWNGNLNFSDPEEEIIVAKGIIANDKKEISGTIPIPANAISSGIARLLCYAVEESNIVGGAGYAKSGYVMDFMFSK